MLIRWTLTTKFSHSKDGEINRPKQSLDTVDCVKERLGPPGETESGCYVRDFRQGDTGIPAGMGSEPPTKESRCWSCIWATARGQCSGRWQTRSNAMKLTLKLSHSVHLVWSSEFSFKKKNLPPMYWLHVLLIFTKPMHVSLCDLLREDPTLFLWDWNWGRDHPSSSGMSPWKLEHRVQEDHKWF